jgi:tetratricopeptide (TPR) repeat protein
VDSLKIDDSATVHYFKAIDYGNRDSISAKINELNEAIQLNPDFGLAYNERGIAWAKMMKFEEAIANYDMAILYLPESPEVYFNKALSCDNIERYNDAQSAYYKFLEHTPQDYLWYIIYARKRIHEINQLNDQD